MGALVSDLRYALLALRPSPAVTLLAVLSLTLGMAVAGVACLAQA